MKNTTELDIHLSLTSIFLFHKQARYADTNYKKYFGRQRITLREGSSMIQILCGSNLWIHLCIDCTSVKWSRHSLLGVLWQPYAPSPTLDVWWPGLANSVEFEVASFQQRWILVHPICLLDFSGFYREVHCLEHGTQLLFLFHLLENNNGLFTKCVTLGKLFRQSGFMIYHLQMRL